MSADPKAAYVTPRQRIGVPSAQTIRGDGRWVYRGFMWLPDDRFWRCGDQHATRGEAVECAASNAPSVQP